MLLTVFNSNLKSICVQQWGKGEMTNLRRSYFQTEEQNNILYLQEDWAGAIQMT